MGSFVEGPYKHRLSDGNTSMMKCFVIFPLRGEYEKDFC